MHRKSFVFAALAVALLLIPAFGGAKRTPRTETNAWRNNIPPRLQWENNHGYCGEVSLISAGLYYGQYMSQYDARAVATKNAPQSSSQLLLGINDVYAAQQMHLKYIAFDTDDEESSDDFLAWVKQNVVKGYPVVIGVFINQYLFDEGKKPGDDEYDHIVPVNGIDTNHPFSDPNYYADDKVYFSDNGLWPLGGPAVYMYNYACGPFQLSREQANAPTSPIYSLPLCTPDNTVGNYGIAITGVADVNGDTLPVRITANLNYEKPDIANKSNTRPSPTPLMLTITVSNLVPNVKYTLYRYNALDSVPESNFNAKAHQAYESWNFEITTGTTYVTTEMIQSDEIAVYRAVKASAP
jgi:hypothetical protein